MNDEIIITCAGADFSYDNEIVASGLSFTVKSGDYICVVGENGSGKSTLVKGLLGLIKPSRGRVTVNAPRGSIGYLPQQTAAQRDFPASVSEIVLSGFSAKSAAPWHTSAQKSAAARNIELLGLSEMSRRCYQELSGGQQQRVLLARALCAADKLLILDEPATGLDPAMTHGLYDALSDINRRLSMTIVMVSHDLNCALHHANKILHLKRGQEFFGTPEEYASSEIGSQFLLLKYHDKKD